MSEGPNYNDIMDFTEGRWPTMTHEEQYQAIAEYRERLPQMRLEKRQAELEASWQRLCPPIYRESDARRLPNLRKFEEVQKWKYGPEGLLLLGRPRRGKTRAVWALLKRLHFQEERRILFFGPKDLKSAVANEWRDREKERPDLTSRVRRAELLFLDDLDTVKPTDAVEETIYDIFEYRLTHEKPVIVTVNQVGDELAERLNTYGRGEKIVERMRESSRVINFG